MTISLPPITTATTKKRWEMMRIAWNLASGIPVVRVFGDCADLRDLKASC
jgi:hypothetical protein